MDFSKQSMGLVRVLIWWSPVCHLQLINEDMGFQFKLRTAAWAPSFAVFYLSLCWIWFYHSNFNWNISIDVVGVMRDGVVWATVFVSWVFFNSFSLFFLFFQLATLDSVLIEFFSQWWQFILDLSAFVLATCWLTVFTRSSSGASKAFSSNFVPLLMIICS